MSAHLEGDSKGIGMPRRLIESKPGHSGSIDQVPANSTFWEASRPLVPTTNRSTLVEQAQNSIRRDILNGQLEPGSRLGVHALARRYDIGTTPVREALARLSAAGFVNAIEQRGFRVSELNRRDLEDLVNTRVVVESAALRLAMELGDDHWEACIIAALHKLERFSATRGPRAFCNFPVEYDALHREFHTSLIKSCNSNRLMQIHSTLYEQTFRYRSFLMARDARLRTVDDEHATIAGFVIRREADAAVSSITSHLKSLLEL